MAGSEGKLYKEVIDGYRRLAFGSNRDVLRLMFSDEALSRSTLEKLNIFNVSSIKRDKSGAVEIKFYGRLDALEHLEGLCAATEGRDGVKAFYDAIARSVED